MYLNMAYIFQVFEIFYTTQGVYVVDIIFEKFEVGVFKKLQKSEFE